ncbi:MAG: hypothetical protein QOI98_3364 [Solirubrobacteraceae bacterium]|jgi:hypothetical protein|nr:hypothetical protein [Solirubrobacteraceae bacterium]
MAEQSYETHVRYHPIYHFFIVPVFAINALVAIVIAVRHFSAMTVWLAIVGLALAGMTLIIRTYPLRVQDRLIRLEEQLRLQRVLPSDLQPRIGDLHTSQLIAMRFCGDDEVCELARAILDGDVKSAGEIKQRIKSWRADWLRV